ncbi:MAG TPA: hypothetical protein VFV38_52090 [Ktedonobacteraceae bacterium]|nr:hypothetical protein [Ktedonobacteraceae bacterium]
MARFLLPFTFDIEMDILEAVVRLAAERRATLIPLSLIPQPVGKRRSVRLELLQQSQDFLEAVRVKAAHSSVPLAPVEVFTSDLVHSILASIDQCHCDGILLATRGNHGCFVSLEVMEQLMCLQPCALWVLHFPASPRGLWLPRTGKVWRGWASRWLRGRHAHSTPEFPVPQTSFQALIPQQETEQNKRPSSAGRETPDGSGTSEVQTLPPSHTGKGTHV